MARNVQTTKSWKCDCGAFHYFAVARNAKGQIEQLQVTVRPGHPTTQEWTGVVYKTDREAFNTLERINTWLNLHGQKGGKC